MRGEGQDGGGEGVRVDNIALAVAEAVIGIVSRLTGELSIPPPFGVGTAIDLAILVVDLSLSACWTLRKRLQESGEGRLWRETMK